MRTLAAIIFVIALVVLWTYAGPVLGLGALEWFITAIVSVVIAWPTLVEWFSTIVDFVAEEVIPAIGKVVGAVAGATTEVFFKSPLGIALLVGGAYFLLAEE